MHMVRAFSLAIVFVLPVGPALADAPPDPSANAALKYWRGFATLPKLSDAVATKLNSDYLTMPLDAQAKEIVTKSDYSLKMMYYGAGLRNWDGGIDCDAEVVQALLPQMHAARTLATIAFLRARVRFDEGRIDDALDDVMAAVTMGRHVSLDGTLIGVLVGYAV